VKNALEWALSGPAFSIERQGIAVASGGLEVVLANLGTMTPYVLEETGGGNARMGDTRDTRAATLDGEGLAFFVGDHLGFDPSTRARLGEIGALPLSVGPVSVHADQAITLIHNELDRRDVLRV